MRRLLTRAETQAAAVEGLSEEAKVAEAIRLLEEVDRRGIKFSKEPSAVDSLLSLLEEEGIKPSFDSGRSMTHHCTFCDAPAPPRGHVLKFIGRYPGGASIHRPVCLGCLPVADHLGSVARARLAQEREDCP